MKQATGTGKYERLLARCEGLAPVPTAVAHPCETTALRGATEASKHGLIVPLLVGPDEKIKAYAAAAGIALVERQFCNDSSNPTADAMSGSLVRVGTTEILTISY